VQGQCELMHLSSADTASVYKTLPTQMRCLLRPRSRPLTQAARVHGVSCHALFCETCASVMMLSL